jgi:hypothetical protein
MDLVNFLWIEFVHIGMLCAVEAQLIRFAFEPAVLCLWFIVHEGYRFSIQHRTGVVHSGKCASLVSKKPSKAGLFVTLANRQLGG